MQVKRTVGVAAQMKKCGHRGQVKASGLGGKRRRDAGEIFSAFRLGLSTWSRQGGHVLDSRHVRCRASTTASGPEMLAAAV